jgi:predicted nucleic acid-binding Zn ribbon protein
MTDDLDSMEHLVNQRRPRIRVPQHVGNVMSSLLSKRGYGRVLATSALDDAWRAAVGETLAADTRAGNIKRGVLEVIVRDCAVLQELTFQKKQILTKLQALAVDQKLKDVRFKVGVLANQ